MATIAMNLLPTLKSIPLRYYIMRKFEIQDAINTLSRL
jgi:hypothetical protein